MGSPPINVDQSGRACYFVQFMMDNDRNGNRLVLCEDA